jgi:hypothetical protein
VAAVDPLASRVGLDGGAFRITRIGNEGSELAVRHVLGGTAEQGVDYEPIGSPIIIPPGANAASLLVHPKAASTLVGPKTVTLTLTPDPAYALGSIQDATILLAGNSVRIASVRRMVDGVTIAWPSSAMGYYRVAANQRLTDPWLAVSTSLVATGSLCTWTDGSAGSFPCRFYVVYTTH